jgi:3-isopropylmalate dehydrogenase
MGLEKNIVVLPGDCSGPEITKEAVKVLGAISQKYGHKFNLYTKPYGAQSYLDGQGGFPDHTREACMSADAVLKGPVGLSIEGMRYLQKKGFRLEVETILPLREALDTYLCFRPVRLPKELADFSPLRPELLKSGIDIMMLRELVGGIYFGEKKEGYAGGKFIADSSSEVCEYTRNQVERFARASFKEAQKRKATLWNIHKANILATSRFWNAIFAEVKNDFPDVVMKEELVDALAAKLCTNPTQYNGVMALENMMGDIITDQAGGIIGSLGLMPSACVNPETGKAYYEPSHGSAPDIAGQNKANPYAMIGSVAFMLDKSFNMEYAARDIWKGMDTVFAHGFRTAELKRENTPHSKVVSTSQFGDLVVQQILGE